MSDSKTSSSGNEELKSGSKSPDISSGMSHSDSFASEDLHSNTSADVANAMASSAYSTAGDVESDLSVREELEDGAEISSESGDVPLLDLNVQNVATNESMSSKDENEDSETSEEPLSTSNGTEKEKLGNGNKQLPDSPIAEIQPLQTQKDTSELSSSLISEENTIPRSQKERTKTGTILNEKYLANTCKTLKSEEAFKSDEDQYDYENDETMPGVEAVHCPKGIMRDLAEPVFDVWRLDRDSMVDHIEYMYHDLGIVRAWKIPRTTLKMFLLGVRERYQDNPYHNFKHCFCVTQMAYSMICKLRLRGLISVDHLGALLTAAVCHDVDHPGLNNSYHSHARTPLAILYNYQSILEQHHFAVACRILSNKERNIFRNVNNRDEVLTNVGKLILATDLARHKGIMEDYTGYLSSGFDFKNSDHVMGLLKIIIKCSDVSNEVRPETVAGPWVERLFAEYYEQSAREKRERLPVTPYMDPDMVNVSESQEGFIRSMMLPMFDELSKLIVEARLYYVNPLYETLMRYEIQNLRERDV